MNNVVQKILFVVNTPDFFMSHRFPLAVAARDAGYEVHVATAAGADVSVIQSQGFQHHVVSFSRSGQNPFYEFKTFIQLFFLFRVIEPDLVHLVTIKPVLYGGIVSRLTGVQSVVAAISGLGSAFLATSGVERLRRWLVGCLYSVAFKQNRLAVIFQNPDDRDTLLSLGALQPSQTRLIRGSGVSLDSYLYLPEPDDKPVIVMAARLLREKGVFEFVEAARLLQERGVDVEMKLIGSPDPGNPSSVTQMDLQRWREEGIVQLPGFRLDIAKQYAKANIVCLPSYYGEGLPKSLVEAAACGRAVVTTDFPGCRDSITADVTGLLIPPENASALADALQKLITEPGLRRQMGKAGRDLAERDFAIEKIVAQHLEIYKELSGDC